MIKSYVALKNETSIRKNLRALEDLYPGDAFGSRSSLFFNGLTDGLVTWDEVQEAREYYGRLWNYTGD